MANRFTNGRPKMLHGRFVNVGKTLTDLQILGCESYHNAFDGRTPPRSAEGAVALPHKPSNSTPLLLEGKEQKKRVGNSEGEWGWEGDRGRRERDTDRWEGQGRKGMEG